MSCALRKPQSSLVRPLIFFSGNLLHSSLIFTHYFNSVYIVQHTRHFIEWTIAVKYKLGEKKNFCHFGDLVTIKFKVMQIVEIPFKS